MLQLCDVFIISIKIISNILKEFISNNEVMLFNYNQIKPD